MTKKKLKNNIPPAAAPGNDPAAKAVLPATLDAIFRDDPAADAYYSADGTTFLNAAQYARLENKDLFKKYKNPN